MKYEISFTPEGEMVVHTDNAEQVAALVKAMRNGTVSKPEKKSHHKKVLAAPVEPDVKLGTQMTLTWNWLVAHAGPNGSATAEIAAGLGITDHAATWRLNRLIEKRLAYRVQRGRYRPGEDPSGKAPETPRGDAHDRYPQLPAGEPGEAEES